MIEKNYNTGRPALMLPEYGRHIQKMIDYCTEIENKEERNKIAHIIIDVMGQLNPHLRDVPDFTHKLWDHLFIISDFKLDVDSPYPKPKPEQLTEKPQRMDYPKHKIKYKHYGRNIEMLINATVEMQEGEEKKEHIKTIANLLKQQYLYWNRDSVNDELIVQDLGKLSDGKINIKDEFQLDSTAEILGRNNKSNGTSHSNNNNNNSKKKKNGKTQHRRRN